VSLRFLIDEDVPRSTARLLREAGVDAVDVRDVGLKGKSDQEVFEFAQREDRLLISCDLGFANTLRYSPTESVGILVIRIPDEVAIAQFNSEILRAIQEVGDRLSRSLAIIEVGRVRLRSK
jgi:predicted nuclease of predicted toxin-antitoxin system